MLQRIVIPDSFHFRRSQVTPESVAYLSALVSVSEEVRGRCHARQPRLRSHASSGSTSGDPFNVDLRLDLHSTPRHSPSNQVNCRLQPIRGRIVDGKLGLVMMLAALITSRRASWCCRRRT